MRHVLGIAKRHLDLKGAKGPKLELDYLRLALAVAEYRLHGDEAQGYLLVMTEAIRKRTEAWAKKYRTSDAVEVTVAVLTHAEREQVEAEVRANRRGMLEGAQGQPVEGRSDASEGALLAERSLRDLIEKREPGVNRLQDRSAFPLRVQWDYYGTRAP